MSVPASPLSFSPDDEITGSGNILAGDSRGGEADVGGFARHKNKKSHRKQFDQNSLASAADFAAMQSNAMNFGSVDDLPDFQMSTTDFNNIDFNPGDLPKKLQISTSNSMAKYNASDLEAVLKMEMNSSSAPDSTASGFLPQIPQQPSIEAIPTVDIDGLDGLPVIVPSASSLDQLDNEISLEQVCEICRQKVETEGLFINGLYYHKSCAKCGVCGAQIEPPKAGYIRDVLCCLECASKNSKELKKCFACNELLDGTQPHFKIDKNIFIHNNCLCCFECNKTIMKGQEKILDKNILCRRCFSVIKERVCIVCKKPIVGYFVKCHKRFYHSEHFKCSQCQKVLHGNNYIIHHNKLFCQKHGQYFLNHCAFCKRNLNLTDEERIKFNGKIYHTVCFVCRVCGHDLNPDSAKLFHNRPHCVECYQRRIRESSSGTDMKKHHHYPQQSVDRRIRYMNDGITVVLPQYEEEKERFLERVEIEAPPAQTQEKRTVPLRQLTSIEFEDL